VHILSTIKINIGKGKEGRKREREGGRERGRKRKRKKGRNVLNNNFALPHGVQEKGILFQ
jgi:hypothetical protein